VQNASEGLCFCALLLSVMMHNTYDVQRTFINFRPCEAGVEDFDNDVARVRRRCNTWDGQMSCSDASTDIVTDGESDNAPAVASSLSDQNHSDDAEDSDLECPQSYSWQGHWGSAPWSAPANVQLNVVPAWNGGWFHALSVTPQLSYIAYVDVSMQGVMDQPQTVPLTQPQFSDQRPLHVDFSRSTAEMSATNPRLPSKDDRPATQTVSVVSTVGATGKSRSSATRDAGQRTIMMKNLPVDYTRDMLLQLLDSEGFAGLYDFVHMPFDFRKSTSFGHAFVNSETHGVGQRMLAHFDCFRIGTSGSPKSCQVCWAQPFQGLRQNVEHYRNSPMMHECVPDALKPVIFCEGKRAVFPAATRRLRAPRTIASSPAKQAAQDRAM